MSTSQRGRSRSGRPYSAAASGTLETKNSGSDGDITGTPPRNRS